MALQHPVTGDERRALVAGKAAAEDALTKTLGEMNACALRASDVTTAAAVAALEQEVRALKERVAEERQEVERRGRELEKLDGALMDLAGTKQSSSDRHLSAGGADVASSSIGAGAAMFAQALTGGGKAAPRSLLTSFKNMWTKKN